MHGLLNRSRSRLDLVLAIILAAAFLPAPLALAQPERPWGGTRESVEPTFMRRDLAHLVEHLKLDDDQKLLSETLFADYEAAISKGAAAMREKVRELRPAPPRPDEKTRQRQREIQEEIRRLNEEVRDRARNVEDPEARRAIMEEYRQRINELREEMIGPRSQIDPDERRRQEAEIARVVDAWSAEKQRLADAFMTDVKALLSEEQLRLWPSLERKLRREKSLRLGQLSGEGVDLFLMVEQLDLEEEARAKIEPLLAAYDARLDAALRARNDAVAESHQKIEEATAAGDEPAARSATDRMIALHKAVRDVNEEYTLAIAAALGEEKGAQFTQAVYERAFPRIYRPTGLPRLFEVARQIGGLEEEAIAAIDTLQSEYTAQLEPRNAELRALTLRHEPEEIRRRIRRMAPAPEGEWSGPRDDPLRDAYTARRRFEASFVERLKALLTEEQFRNLPGARRWIDPRQWPDRAAPGSRGAGGGR